MPGEARKTTICLALIASVSLAIAWLSRGLVLRLKNRKTLSDEAPLSRQVQSGSGLDERDTSVDTEETALHARSLLSEVHITIASVIQGITIAIIGERIYNAASGLLSLGNPLGFVTFSIYAVASFVIAILFWVRFIHGALITLRHFTYLSNIIFFLQAIFQILTFYNIDEPVRWSFWGVMTALTTAALHWYIRIEMGKRPRRGDEFYRITREGQGRLAVQMLVTALIGSLGCTAMSVYTPSYPPLPAIVGTLYLVALLIAVYGSHRSALANPVVRWVYLGE